MNKIREHIETEQEVISIKETTKEKSSGRNFFSLLLWSEWINKDSAANALPFVLFLTFLAMFYIGNRHYAERNVREIEKLNKELKELRWEYMTTKAQLMYRSKQTEVAKQAGLFGLKESTVPPKKIIVKE